MSHIVGIDLGTTNSRGISMSIVARPGSSRTRTVARPPSIVAYTPEGVLVGDARGAARPEPPPAPSIR